MIFTAMLQKLYIWVHIPKTVHMGPYSKNCTYGSILQKLYIWVHITKTVHMGLYNYLCFSLDACMCSVDSHRPCCCSPPLVNVISTESLVRITHNFVCGQLPILFNTIFDSADYPDDWAQGLIYPVHKKGDKSDPQNYRKVSDSFSCESF